MTAPARHSHRTDPWRPAFHYTPAANWVNDPNGLVWHGGKYHLFYQHNPFGDQWGHMSWGHAVSSDLVDWQELPVAIAEDERVSIYSGSVVVDTTNTSGFGSAAQAPLVAVYTGCLRVPTGGQAQELAYSTDGGSTWTQHAGNPVLDLGLRDFRDPKVFWHAPTARWVMVVVVPDDRCAKFFASFDGTRFVPEPEAAPCWADAGSDFYAALSWAHLPARTGQPPRQVWLAWMNCHRYAKHTPTAPWRGAMTVPRDLQLRRSAAGAWQLLQQPVAELQRLRGNRQQFSNIALASGHTLPLLPTGTAFDGDARCLEVHLHISAAHGECSLLLRAAGASEGNSATRVGYDARTVCAFVDRTHAGFNPPGDALYQGRRSVAVPPPSAAHPLRLQVLLDRCSVEVFVGDGEASITELIFPDDTHRGVLLQARGGTAQLALVQLWPLAAAVMR
jgi:sucrose-6-phosphate hydrolase SacC (GH32 family)